MLVIACILTATTFVARSVTTKAQPACVTDARGNDLVVNCNGQNLTDDVFEEMFASLTIQDGEKANKTYSLAVLLEFNELRTLQTIPKTSHTARMTQLSFKKNQIVHAETGVFQNLPRLRYLDLSYNQLTGSSLIREVFQGSNEHEELPLLSLNLEKNNISSLNFDLFYYLRNLKSLILSRNPITSIDSSFANAFHFLGNLQVLEMTEAKLSTLPDNFLRTNVIRELYMTGNRFTRVPKCLRNIARSLRILNLNGNSIQKLDAASFDTLSYLSELHLNGMETLTAIAANTFSPLINLRKLECSYNSHLNAVDAAAFEGLKSKWLVQEVHLSNNGFEFLAEDTLPWDKVKVLDISGNPWRCDCSSMWLLNFTRKRQHSDPESNLGMHCEYPPELRKVSLMHAETLIKCSSTCDSASEFSLSRSLSFLWSTSAFFVCVIILTIIIILYLVIMKRRMRAKMLNVRYSGVLAQSMIRYKLARLNDDNENDGTQTIVGQS